MRRSLHFFDRTTTSTSSQHRSPCHFTSQQRLPIRRYGYNDRSHCERIYHTDEQQEFENRQGDFDRQLRQNASRLPKALRFFNFSCSGESLLLLPLHLRFLSLTLLDHFLSFS